MFLFVREIEPLIAILRSVADAGGVQPSEVGVLTPYDAQKARLKKAINEEFVSHLSIYLSLDCIAFLHLQLVYLPSAYLDLRLSL